MHAHARTALVLGVVLAGATVLGQSGTASSAPPSRGDPAQQVELTMLLSTPWLGGHQHYIDRGKKGPSAGDLFLGTDAPVFDEGTGDRIGSADAVELIVSGRHNGTVTGQQTLRLPGGHVDVDGIMRHSDKPLQLPVIGGTGRFAGAGGQLTLVREDRERKVSIMKLELLLP